MNVMNLKQDKLLIPLENMDPLTIEEVKCRILDGIVTLVGGALSADAKEKAAISALAFGEPEYEAAFPPGLKTSLEMCGFLNGYFIRNADWGDTFRRSGLGNNTGGHPSDMVATILALCNKPDFTGKDAIELLHLGYQLWWVVQWRLLWRHPEYDYTTALSITTPVMTGVCFGASPERVQNALGISMTSPTMTEQLRVGSTTNMKSAATAYSIARGFWIYRLSEAINAPNNVFDGKFGFYNTYGPLEGGMEGPDGVIAYKDSEVKPFACYNAAQSTVDCAVCLHEKVKDRLDDITKIKIHLCKIDSNWAIRPGQAQYPETHADADHNQSYCVSTALNYGMLSPMHYEEEHLKNAVTRRLMDVIEVERFTDEEMETISDGDGACYVEVFLNDGTSFKEVRGHAMGVLSVLDGQARIDQYNMILDMKCRTMEECCGVDFSEIKDIVHNLENHSGPELLAALHRLFIASGN